MTRRTGRAAVCAALAFGLAAGGAPSAFAETTMDYVPDGLIAQWDGIENAGRYTHVDEPTVWKDLVGSSDLTLPSWMTPTENGFLSAGSASKPDAPVLSSIEGLTGNDVTVEVFARFVRWTDTSDYNSFQQIISGPCGRVGYRGNVVNGFVVYLPPGGGDATRGQLYDSQPTGVSRTEPQTLAIRVTLNSTTAKNGLDISGAPAPLADAHYDVALPSDWTFFANPRSDLEISAIRVYNRRLTDEEVAVNAEVDRVRFIEGRTTGIVVRIEDVRLNDANIVVAAESGLQLPATMRFVSGLKPDLSDGVEVELGTLTSAAPVTFPVVFARGAKTYCRFVTEDAVGGVWRSPVLKIPLPAFDSLSYAAGGLVAQWDGVENAGRGTHVDAPTVWKDLVGSSDLTLPSWMTPTENGFLSAGSASKPDAPVLSSIEGLTGNDVTVEVVARFVRWTDTSDYYSFQQIISGPCGRVGYRGNVVNGFVVYLPPGGGDATRGQLYDSQPTGVSRTEPQTLAIRVTRNSTTAKNGLDIFGAPAPLSDAQYNAALPSDWTFFANPRSDLEISAIRVYNRRLTAREVAENALVDRARFAGACDATEAATLRVEYDGDGAACREGVRYWPIPEGTVGCATERFVQDADGYTSTCLGWTLYVETGDGVWEVEDSGTGCSMSYRNDDRRRRLVWHTARSRELPGGYVRLECLEAHGQQMIDTGYYPNYRTRLKASVSFAGKYTGSNPGLQIFGTPANDLVFRCNFGSSNANALYFRTYNAAHSVNFTVDSSVVATRNTISVYMPITWAEYGGVGIGVTSRTAAQVQPDSLRICGGEVPFDCYETMRLYGLVLKDDTTPRRDFVPALSLETGARGLYDYVTGEFRTNMVENAADFGGAVDGILVEGKPVRIGEPTIPYGWSQLEEGAAFELAEPNAVKFGRKSVHVKSIARYTFDEQTHSWTPAGRTHGSKVTVTHDGVPTKYVLEWVPNGLSVIVR